MTPTEKFAAHRRQLDQCRWHNPSDTDVMAALAHAHHPIILGDAVENPRPWGANVVWVARRQQGKMTTLARFIATMVCGASAEASLVFIYSTSKGRATSILDLVKKHLHALDSGPTVVDNGDWITVTTSDNHTNTVEARPTDPSACADDSPTAAFFDEIGFVPDVFWDTFARDFLLRSPCVTTCATTRPMAGSRFEAFLANADINPEAFKVIRTADGSRDTAP